MNINTKLIIALGILCVFVVISGIVGILYTQSISDELNIVTTTTTPLVETIDDMIITLLEMNVLVGEIATEPDPQQRSALERQLNALDKNFKKTEAIAYNLIKDENLKITLNKATKEQRAFYESAKQITATAHPAQVKTLQAEVNAHTEAAINTLEEVSIRAYTFNKEANAASFQAVRSTILFLSLTTILSLISAVVIGVYLARSLIKPINTLSEAASQLSLGNFDITVEEPTSDDEIAHLTLVFNKMIKSLQKLIKESPGLKRYIDLSVQKKQLTEQEYKLAAKTIYLIKDRNPHRAYDIVADKVNKGMRALCITRDHPETIIERYGVPPVDWVWLTEAKDKTFFTASSLSTLLKKIADFTSKHPSSMILLDRVDYLIAQNSFSTVLKFVTTLHDQMMTTNALGLLPLDPACLDPRDLSLLEKELKDLPPPSEKEKIPEELLKILTFIKNRKVLNKPASFKDVSKEFAITAPTTKKKLKELQELNLIHIVKQGRNKLLEPTPEAEKQL